MSRILIRIAICAAIVVAVAIGAYCYWTSTPLFVFQETALAIRQHDSVKFDHCVDSPKLVDSALTDLLINPIEKMPGLSEIGRRVAIAAISIPVENAEKILLRHIENFVSGSRNVSNVASPYLLASYSASSGDLRNALSETRRDVSDEFAKLRALAYGRMQEYALGHQEGIVGRLFIMANTPQKADIRSLLRDLGLQPENFRGIAYCNTADDGSGENCRTGVKFISPKVGHEVILEVELTKGSGTWRISRLSNLEQLMQELDQTYTYDYQALIQSSVRGIDSRAAKVEVNALTKRISQSAAVKNLLQGLNKRYNVQNARH